jgi:hypothetical protein
MAAWKASRVHDFLSTQDLALLCHGQLLQNPGTGPVWPAQKAFHGAPKRWITHIGAVEHFEEDTESWVLFWVLRDMETSGAMVSGSAHVSNNPAADASYPMGARRLSSVSVS